MAVRLDQFPELVGKITTIAIQAWRSDPVSIQYWVRCADHGDYRIEPRHIASGDGTPFILETDFNIGNDVIVRGESVSLNDPRTTVTAIVYVSGIGCRYVCDDGREYAPGELMRRQMHPL